MTTDPRLTVGRITQLTTDPEPAVRMSRRFDPRTSHEAAWRFVESGKRLTQHQRILRFMLEDVGGNGSTAAELERSTGIRAHKRMPELERDGYVTRGLPRKCRVTGESALTWWLA